MILLQGQYSGIIRKKLHLDSCIVSNTVYYRDRKAAEWHSHENFHACFVYSGGKAETKKSTKYNRHNGSIFSYESEEIHRWISPDPISKSLNIELKNSFFVKNDLDATHAKINLESKQEAAQLMLQIQKEIGLNDYQSILSVKSILLELFSKSMDNNSVSKPKWVLKVEEFIVDNWDLQISLEDIAHNAGVHKVTISKNFRKYFGCTLGEFRRKIKIRKGLDFIKYTDLSLTEIAHACGFADQSHFIRVFKSRTGYLPKEFRKM